MAEEKQQKGIQVYFPDNLKGGVYSNLMVVSHTKEEFVLDFMMVAHSAGSVAGSVTSRVVISPGHMKRMISALQQNVTRYEEKFGKLTAAEEPPKPTMGFHPPST
jgi:hypothetical protein